jgi:hypothetical protein
LLVRAQELGGAEERVVGAQRSLTALEGEEVAARAKRDAWRAHTRGVEIMEHEVATLDGRADWEQ